jgi:hypothetical protein
VLVGEVVPQHLVLVVIPVADFPMSRQQSQCSATSYNAAVIVAGAYLQRIAWHA